ncbi:MAG: hypothetical protein KKA65_02795 [Nanoarchaeota archaeon]|nr:hypothetical protein [Nanoarchaeota archaeon]MBU4351519.1 hypothetical protein [Nanoarchaeota archaeon]MBU4456405.1 hypothetical protein [Nanoarchaeota archaeon]MCG2719734.1 hypothetical protein [Nanoarchaeota archaeon]
MLVKIYGLLDLALGINLLFLYWNIFPFSVLIFALPILIKAIYYIKDPSSIVDLVAVIFTILAFLGYFPIFTFVFAFWFLQKGFRSMF